MNFSNWMSISLGIVSLVFFAYSYSQYGKQALTRRAHYSLCLIGTYLVLSFAFLGQSFYILIALALAHVMIQSYRPEDMVVEKFIPAFIILVVNSVGFILFGRLIPLIVIMQLLVSLFLLRKHIISFRLPFRYLMFLIMFLTLASLTALSEAWPLQLLGLCLLLVAYYLYFSFINFFLARDYVQDRLS